MALLRVSLQVLAAVAVVLILFVIGYYIFNREALRAVRETAQLRNKVDIFTGVKDMALSSSESYNTMDPNAGLYKNLRPSVNQTGGIEYSYNFWLYKNTNFQTPPDTDTTAYSTDTGLNENDIILLLRGVDKAVPYNNLCGVQKTDVYIKAPLIKLENNGDSLTVEFNTKDSPDVVREGATNYCGQSKTDWNQMNSHKVSVRNLRNTDNFNSQWFMVTVVLQDTFPSDPLPFRNKARARIYINGVLELDQYIDSRLDQVDDDPSVLKQNNGNLYVMPQINISGTTTTKKPSASEVNNIMMADLSYFNYVLSNDEIIKMYQRGFNKYYAVSPIEMPGGDIFNKMSYSDGKKRQLIST